MPDLENALSSFDEALKAGDISVHPGELDPNIFLHFDRPNGEPRLTYVRLKDKSVTALISFIQEQPVEGTLCWSVGWAVPKELRGQGRAGDAFLAALRELRHGLVRNGVKEFYIEAIVEDVNMASHRVAEKVVSSAVKRDVDRDAGVPVIQYLRKVDASSEI